MKLHYGGAGDMLFRHLAVVAWLIGMYGATALAAMFSFMHLAPPLLEARNIIIHSTAYAVLAVLVIRALRRLPSRRDWPVLLAIALALGIGQEILQSVLRRRVFPINSAFDLLVDVGGAALGLWLYTRCHAARPQPLPADGCKQPERGSIRDG